MSKRKIIHTDVKFEEVARLQIQCEDSGGTHTTIEEGDGEYTVICVLPKKPEEK